MIPAADWQAFIRTLEYTVYDDEATLYWYIDENESNLQYDSSTGHFYEFVPAEGIQWTAAYQAAGGYFNDELNATGYLMQIDSEAEQQTAERLADGKKVWVGGTKNTSFSGTTDWSWMTASGAHKLEGYTNWASGQPGTASDRMYMSLNTNGQWLAERNDGTQSYTVVDMAQHWGNVNLYLNSPSRGYDINLTNGHKYYVHAAGAGVGDSNASLRFDFPALGISFTTNSYKDYLNKSTIVTYTGATGKQTGTFAIQHTGPDVSGIYTQIQQFDVIDLTAVFGAGNEPSAAYCAQFNGMTGSKTVTYNSETTDKAGYLIEYGEADVNFSRNTRSAYDIDVVPDGLDGRRTVKVAISAEDRVYDGTETNAQVSFRLDGGGTLPEADAEELLAALQVTYTETGKTTDANGTGSEAIHSNNLELYHATVAPKDAASPMLIYSTDRREGYVKVHKNASKEEILNRASEKLKSILTNAIFHDERISIKKEKSSKRDALRQSLEKAINVKSEIQNQLATLAKDLAAFSGRKTAYGYLPPQLKQSVDKLLENIVTHDATCIMAYESYAASHRALLQHYAKRPDVLEEKMSEWRHDFFHPIKGGDTTRHNLILKAALSLSPSLEVEPDTKKYFQVNPACPHSEDTARKTAAEYLYGSHKVPATKGYAALESLSKSKTGSTSSWALYYMAKMRLYGIGTTRNYEEALRLFAQSQQAGNEYAEQALRTARQEHIVYHAKSALAITRTLIRQLAQNMSQTTTQNHTMGLTRHQKLRRAMKHKKELHEPLYP